MKNISRRHALALIGVSGLGAACQHDGAQSSASLIAGDGTNALFQHGVASGDPDATSLIIWTRITTQVPDVDLVWDVAADADMKDVIVSGNTSTSAARDWTIKVLVTGLEPGRIYYYRFRTAEGQSPVGRTRTLPVTGPERLGIALASCSNYAFGHFNAYAAIAADEAVDFVLHTGDYIYEYGGPDGWGEETASVLGRPHDPPHEIVTLDDYRRRHAQYKTDSGSLAMHAAHPLLCCWDDHESANNPWVGGAQNHQAESEGSWEVRRAASVQAYYEWMPIRDPSPDRSALDFWRTYVFGDLATLVTLETRHTARGEQVDYELWQPLLKTEEDYERFRREVIGDPARAMLSEAMEQDLASALRASRDRNQPWRLIGNPMPIARMLVPDLISAGVLPPPGETSLDAHKRLAWLGAHRLPFYTDTWDGYPAARERFYDLCKAAGAQDLIVLTGDSHSFWLNALRDAGGQPMGIELGTAGISSPGDFVESGFDDEQARALDKAFADLIDEVVWTDNFHQGYVRLSLVPEQAIAEFVAVRTVLIEDSAVTVIRTANLVPKGVSLTIT